MSLFGFPQACRAFGLPVLFFPESPAVFSVALLLLGLPIYGRLTIPLVGFVAFAFPASSPSTRYRPLRLVTSSLMDG